MHGLGGMKIFERFSVADDVLPSMYQNQTDFIITGLEHTIEGNTWDTNIIGNTISRNSSTVVNPNRVGDTGEPIEWASGTQLKSVEGILKANFAEIMDEGVWGT